MKLKLADPEEYYKKHWDENGFLREMKEWAEEKASKKPFTVEKLCGEPSNLIFTLILGPKYHNADPLFWVNHGNDHNSLKPMFWPHQMTYSDTGEIIEEVNFTTEMFHPLQEFHKLMKNEVASDMFGNSWKLLDDSI